MPREPKQPKEKPAVPSADAQDSSPRDQAIEKTLQELTKRFGEGTIMRLGDAQHLRVNIVPTGSLAVDLALGIGGLPRGRITEIYGPESSGKTTLCLHTIAEAQARGGICAFVDMEHALDPVYAERIGVDVGNLYIAQPDTAEQALEITEALVRSGALDVVVLDSVAALVPKNEIEGEMGDSFVGLQARLMSQALRKLVGAIKNTDTAMIFTNQLREKIGVMFGCFHYNARILLADGRTEKIGKIVNQRMDVLVQSYNVKTGQFEPRRIKNWFNNGKTDRFLQFIVDSNEGRGRREFGVTENHLLLGESGYSPAGEYKVGDKLMTGVKHYLTPGHEQIVMGSILGDGSLRYASDYNVSLRIGHGKIQTEYALWKESLLKGLVRYRGRNSKGGHSFDTLPMYELARFHRLGYQAGKKNPTPEMIDQLTPLAIAIWYMDDGSFDSNRQNRCSICAVGFPLETRERLVAWFVKHGIYPTLTERGLINFGVVATEQFHEMIARYIHPSMDYKLLPNKRGRFVPFELDPCERLAPVPMPILKIYEKPKTRGMLRFDIEVEGNHCYLVDGVVVHNSPETTTGGRALKFYASVRLDIRKIQAIKQGEEVVGNRTRVKVTKNKVAPPFRQAEFDIMYNEGISKSGDILDLGVSMGIIDKRGAFFRFKEGMLGQGRENAKQYLRENPAVAYEIEMLIRENSAALPASLISSAADEVAPATLDE